MSFNDELRKSSKALLQQLQDSQDQIKKLIISTKHSDPSLLGKMPPLTSTLFNRDTTNRFISGQQTKNENRSKHPRDITKVVPPITKSILHDAGNLRPPRVFPASNTVRTVHEKSARASETIRQPARASVRFDFETPNSSHANKNVESDDEEGPISIENRPPPLLGYDWIADDVENQINPDVCQQEDMSDSFLEDMKQFRKINRAECHSRQQYSEIMKTPKTPKMSSSMRFDQKSPRPDDLYESRIVNYTVNDRLFPVPVNPTDDVRQGDDKSPRYIRVSIPKKSLSSPYRFAFNHRRMNTREDSLALPHHCVLGMQNTAKNASRPPLTDRTSDSMNLDLRASLRPPDQVSKLQLKSGQAQIPKLGKSSAASQPASSLLDESYALQYEHQKLRKRP